MRSEVITLNAERNVTLTAYLLDAGGEFRNIPKRPLMLVLPGGGYQYCSDREADPVAMVYLKAGYHAAILRYSVKADAKWPNPLQDYEQAMEYIRDHADEWAVYEDKIAVIGFSAGGHLAAAAATMARNRPNAAILGYAVTGEDVKGCNPSAPDTISEVDTDTPPCFVFATRTDNLVPISNSLRFQMALDEKGIAFESHIYGFGPHGFSTADSSVQDRNTVLSPSAQNWVGDSIVWLKSVLGDFGEDGMTEPVCPRHINGDWEEFLSVDCTFGRLMANPAAAEAVRPLMEAQAGQIPGRTGGMSMGKYENRYFPVFLDLSDKKVVVAGAGTIAKRRIRALLDFTSRLTVIAPEVNPELRRLEEEGRLRVVRGPYSREILAGASLVIAATNDNRLNQEIYEDCQALGVPVNVSSDKTKCDFYFPVLAYDDTLVAGVSSGGADPSRSRCTADRIRQMLREEGSQKEGKTE